MTKKELTKKIEQNLKFKNFCKYSNDFLDYGGRVIVQKYKKSFNIEFYFLDSCNNDSIIINRTVTDSAIKLARFDLIGFIVDEVVKELEWYFNIRRKEK